METPDDQEAPKGTLFRTIVTGPAGEGQVPPALVFVARFEDASDARKFAEERAVEAWGQEAADLSHYTFEPI